MKASALLVGIRWGAASWQRAPALLKRVLRILQPAPLHWALTAVPDGDSQAIELLRGRLDKGDVLLGVGFAGACHPALTLAEVEREIGWCVHNPWSTGLFDTLGSRPSVLAPFHPDVDRPQVIRSCLRHRFAAMAIAGDGPLTLGEAHGLKTFSFLSLPQPGQRPKIPKTPTFVMLDLDQLPAEPAPAVEMLQGLASLLATQRRSFLTLDEVLNASASSYGRRTPLDLGMFPVPELAFQLEAAAATRRKKRRRTIEIRQTLEALSTAAPRVPSARRPSSERQRGRSPIAHMQGDALLAGERFDLRLSGGRFCGLVSGGRSLTPARPAYTRLSAGRRPLPLRVRGAFSYEETDGTGLREELSIEPGGRLVVDYSFRGDRPRLSVDGSATFPDLPAQTVIDEWIPLAITLSEVAPGWSADIDVVASDGSRGTRRLAEADGWQLLVGSSFAAGGLVIEAGGPGACGLMLFRIARGPGRRRYLETSPAGVHRRRTAGGLPGTTIPFGFTLDVPGG